MKIIQASLFLLFLMAIGCSSVEDPPLPGERIPILLGNIEVEPDPALADLPVRLPQPNANNGWPQAGGFADHANHHLALNGGLKPLWSVSVGDFSDDEGFYAQPVIAEGRIYTLDHDYEIRALDASSGKLIWRTALEVPKEDSEAIGGGLAYHQGRIYVATGYKFAYALTAENGKLLWEADLGSPTRAAPTVADQRVVIVTIDNQTRALNSSDGSLAWRHFGIAEAAGLRGGAAPALGDNVAIIPYSSGEVFAIRLANGRELWSESLASLQPLDALANLADIRALPVMDRGLVYVIGHAGRMMAIDLRTGVRAWERRLAGTEMPWAAGDYVFVVGIDATLIALTRSSGRVKWRTYLPRYEDMEDLEGLIVWRGPILAGDRLILANNLGELLSVSPYDGTVLGKIELGSAIGVSPVVSDNRLYVLQNNGTLRAFH